MGNMWKCGKPVPVPGFLRPRVLSSVLANLSVATNMRRNDDNFEKARAAREPPLQNPAPPSPLNLSPLKFMKATPAPETGEEAIPRRSGVDKPRLTLDYRCMKKKPTTPMKNPPHPGKVVRVSCLEPPVICTPNELMEAGRADNAD